MTKLGVFFRNSIQFMSAELVGRAAGLATIPILTRYLSTEEMGELAIATVVAGLLATVLSLGLTGAVFRMHFTVAPAERPDLHTTLIRFSWIVAGVVTAISVIVPVTLFRDERLFGAPLVPTIMLAGLLGASSLGGDLLPSAMLRADGRAKTALAGQSAKALAAVTGTVVLVGVLRLEVVGAITAHILATVFMGGVVLYGIRDLLRGEFKSHALASSLRYGLPLLPHFLAHWALSGIDRFFIASQLGLTDAGVYNVVYGLTAAMLAVVWAGGHALTPLIGATTGISKSSEADETAARATTWFVAFVMVVGTCGVALRFELLAFVAGSEYVSGAQLVPWLALAFAMVGLYSPAINVVNIVTGRPFLIGGTTVIAAGVNALATYALINWIGVTGAAIATAIAYGVMLLGFIAVARNASTIPFDIRSIGSMFTGSVAAGVILSVLGPGSLWARLSVGGAVALLLIYTAVHRTGRHARQGLS